MRDRRVKFNERARAQAAYALGARERELLAEEERKERIALGLPEPSDTAPGEDGKAGPPQAVSTADVGFDPGKADYTEEQLTNLAMELYFKNLEKGLDEEGKPLKTSVFG
jgi:hypothetical protein